MEEVLEQQEKKPNKFQSFWKWFKSNLMKTTNGMAIGLFGTLILGTIIDLFTRIPGLEAIAVWSGVIKGLMGAGIGLGVALSLKRNGVAVVATMAAGMVGNYAFSFATGAVTSIGDPLSCYISSIICLLAIKYIMRKKTPADLILIPAAGIIFSILYSFLLATYVHYITVGIGELIKIAFDAVPFSMCIIISVLVGMALTAPISSVAICVAINIGSVPLAAAAALIGCCTQMVGFAVHTARDNKCGSVIAVGIGTSMLQFKNIIRKPLIWLPTIIVSAVLGPLAMIFPLQSWTDASAYISTSLDAEAASSALSSLTSTLSVGAGMGTSGLVGPLNFFAAHNYDWVIILEIIGICVIAPIILVFLIDLLFRKLGWIKKGDFSLTNDL